MRPAAKSEHKNRDETHLKNLSSKRFEIEKKSIKFLYEPKNNSTIFAIKMWVFFAESNWILHWFVWLLWASGFNGFWIIWGAQPRPALGLSFLKLRERRRLSQLRIAPKWAKSYEKPFAFIIGFCSFYFKRMSTCCKWMVFMAMQMVITRAAVAQI